MIYSLINQIKEEKQILFNLMEQHRKPLKVIATKQDLVMYDYAARSYYESDDVDLLEPGLGTLSLQQIKSIASSIQHGQYKYRRL